MKNKFLFLALGILLFGCDNATSSNSLGGGVLIPDSEYNPLSSLVSSSSSSSENTNLLSDCFIGKFVGDDQILQVRSYLEVDEKGLVKFSNDYGNNFEFSFVEENEKKTAEFVSDEGIKLVMENGASFMFVTIDEGNIFEDTYCQYDGAQFVRE